MHNLCVVQKIIRIGRAWYLLSLNHVISGRSCSIISCFDYNNGLQSCSMLVEMSERHVLELFAMLENDGWKQSSFSGRKAELPKPYMHGDNKEWFLHQRATSFSALYFECLLKALHSYLLNGSLAWTDGRTDVWTDGMEALHCGHLLSLRGRTFGSARYCFH